MNARLGVITTWLEQGVQACEAGGADRLVAPLRKVLEHAIRVGQRLTQPWPELKPLNQAGTLPDEQASRLYAIDHRILELMSGLIVWLDQARSTSSHDRLAHIESGLHAIDGMLDERSGLMREMTSRPDAEAG